MKKRILSVLLCFGVLLGFLPPMTSAAEESETATMTNLVVFCKFAEEEEFIHTRYEGATVFDIVDNTYSKSVYSVKDYFDVVSGGKAKLQTLYLLDNGESVTLSKHRGYYAEKDEGNPEGYESGMESLRISELAGDWGEAVNAAIAKGNKPMDGEGNSYNFADLDRDGDGEIDLITVIYKNTTQNINVGWSSPLWDYQTRSNRVLVIENGKTYTSGEYVQLTCNYQNINGSILYKGADGIPILGTPGKICHETMHALGLKDLYRSDNTSKVAYMSLMGKHTSPIGQYISVKERESLGWLDSDQIKLLGADDTYTLYEASAAGNVVAYKRDLPNGKTLYLEYRRFDETGNKYDNLKKELYSCRDGSQVKALNFKNGLVCYLVNTGVRFPSNLQTSGYNWNMEVVPYGNYANNTNCAVGVHENLDIYSGTGWINVSVIGMTDTYLTFEITGLPEMPERTPHDLGAFEKSEVTATYGDTGLGQTVTSSTGNVEYSSSDTAVASVDKSTGKLTICGAGETTITAEVLEDTAHTGANTSYRLKVNRKELSIEGISAVNRAYIPGNCSVDLTGGVLSGVVNGDSVSVSIPVSGKVEDENTGVGKAVSVELPVLVGAAAGNYTLAPIQNLTVTITKAAGKVLPAVHVSRKCGVTSEESKQLDLTGIPERAGNLTFRVGDVSAENGVQVSKVEVDEIGLVKFTMTGGTGGEQVTLPIVIGSEHYEDCTVNIIVTLTAKELQAPLKVSAATDTILYGQTLALQTSGGSGEGAISYEVTGGTGAATLAGNVLTPTKAGTVQVRARKEADEEYAEAESDSFMVTIQKATPAGLPVYTEITGSNRTLSDAKLTTDGGTFSVPGTVMWVAEDGETELPGTTVIAANKSYRWCFVPTEEANYHRLTGEVILWRQTSAGQGGFSGGGSGTSSGGGDVGTAGKVSVKAGEGGTIDTSPSRPVKGSQVTVTVKPDEGYEIERLVVTDRKGKELEIIAGENGTFQFTQPAGAVTVQATFRKIESEEEPTESTLEKREWNNQFEDITEQMWYFEAVKFAYEHGLMSGMGATTFEPEGTANREQFVTVLWRMAGCPVSDYPVNFRDVREDWYYTEAIRWAVGAKMIDGYGDGNFGVGDQITREQLAVMLYRYTQPRNDSLPDERVLAKFKDGEQVSEYARKAIVWCNEEGIIGGYHDGFLRPQRTATRAEMAQIFKNYVNLTGSET